MIRKLLIAAGLVAGIVLASACRTARVSEKRIAPVSAPTDTLRGMVAVTGAEPVTQVVLRLGTGASVRLVGEQAAGLDRLSGAEVWIEGQQDPGNGAVTVGRYAVRSVDGAAVIDGTLVQEGAGLALLLAGGARHKIASPPPALRNHVGARVWISGPPGAPPTAFGVILPARQAPPNGRNTIPLAWQSFEVML
jgi:hypothetical protein